jgi:hypothetical protein
MNPLKAIPIALAVGISAAFLVYVLLTLAGVTLEPPW